MERSRLIGVVAIATAVAGAGCDEGAVAPAAAHEGARAAMALAPARGHDAGARAEVVPVHPRGGWRAAAPRVERMRENAQVRRVTIHHTADRNRAARSDDAVLRAIQRFHVDSKRWGDVAYHYFVGPAGEVWEGRDPRYAADTSTEYDTSGHVTVCLLGNFEEEEPTPAATRSLGRVVTALLQRHGLATSDVRLHQNVARTLCPGKQLRAFWASQGAAEVTVRLGHPHALSLLQGFAP